MVSVTPDLPSRRVSPPLPLEERRRSLIDTLAADKAE